MLTISVHEQLILLNILLNELESPKIEFSSPAAGERYLTELYNKVKAIDSTKLLPF